MLGHIQNTIKILFELPFWYLVVDVIIHKESYFLKYHGPKIMVLIEKKGLGQMTQNLCSFIIRELTKTKTFFSHLFQA